MVVLVFYQNQILPLQLLKWLQQEILVRRSARSKEGEVLFFGRRVWTESRSSCFDFRGKTCLYCLSFEAEKIRRYFILWMKSRLEQGKWKEWGRKTLRKYLLFERRRPPPSSFSSSSSQTVFRRPSRYYCYFWLIFLLLLLFPVVSSFKSQNPMLVDESIKGEEWGRRGRERDNNKRKRVSRKKVMCSRISSKFLLQVKKRERERVRKRREEWKT